MKHANSRQSKNEEFLTGNLRHAGGDDTGKSKITVIRYNEDCFDEEEVTSTAALLHERSNENIMWINIDNPDVKMIEDIGGIFGLHPLVQEDILNTDHRPKTEDFGDYIYIVLKYFSRQDSGSLTPEQVSIILGDNFLLSFKEKDSSLFDPIADKLRSNKGRIRKSKTDSLAHAIMDHIVDNYFVVLENLEEKIEYIEDDLVSRATSQNLHAIHGLKRELILLRKSLWPLREAISVLERSESPLITKSTHIYFKDIYDHIIAIIDTVETFRDMLSGMMDIYLSIVSNRLNEVMKVLTIIATIFMPLTFIAGVYGMNFKYMPELEFHWGYFGVLGLMLCVALFMLKYFKKKKWL